MKDTARKLTLGVKNRLAPLFAYKGRYPDFVGIGAQKAGTTWLYRNLRDHPQIWMPKKEVHYFDQKINDTSFNLRTRFLGKRPEDQAWRQQVKHWTGVHLRKFYLPGLLWVYRYYMRPPDDGWYAALFAAGEGKTTGEITPNYSVLDREQIAHVHEIMPEAKIIFLMRNPIERDWSQTVMYFDKREGRRVEEVRDEEFLDFTRSQSSLHTDYLRTLENWGAFFPEKQIFVGFLEDIHFYPNRLLRRLYSFLGVEAWRTTRLLDARSTPATWRRCPRAWRPGWQRPIWMTRRPWRSASGATPPSGATRPRGSSRTRPRRRGSPTLCGSRRCGRTG